MSQHKMRGQANRHELAVRMNSKAGHMSHVMGLSCWSLSRLPVSSRKGGLLCHRRWLCLVSRSNTSRKGLLPSGDAPEPACTHTHLHALIQHLYFVSDHITGFSLVCKHSHGSKNAAFAAAAAIARRGVMPHIKSMHQQSASSKSFCCPDL